MWEQESQRERGFMQLWTRTHLAVGKYPESPSLINIYNHQYHLKLHTRCKDTEAGFLSNIN